MRKIQDRLDKKAAKTENSQNTWNEALDLFAGRGTDTLKYQNLQKRLLSAELTRQ
jgi:adenine specific DNA methylase Mod